MARKATIQFRKDTYENFEADESGDGILHGEAVYLTDKKALVVGDGVNGVAGHPTLRSVANYYNTEVDGWSVTKDNGDIERKFWKDDFSVDSSDNYTITGTATGWGTGEITITSDGTITKPLPSESGKITATVSKPTLTTNTYVNLPLMGLKRVMVALLYKASGNFDISVWDYNPNATSVKATTSTGIAVDTNPHSFGIEIVTKSECYMLFDGMRIGTSFSLAAYTLTTYGAYNRFPAGENLKVHTLDYVPSISYADPFTSDTVSGANGRYQAVEGTVAYDTDHMNVVTASGVNGKASGRLKSYKFTEGSQIYDVTLPTGADGDFITLVTHSANGLMTDGIGVGLQSDGTGNWNLATLSGTTVTEGADSGLDDADVARIEIEKDLSGAYWYYIYDAAGTKPTTATGKLFTTLTEGYTGWYANGVGTETQTFEIDNISIRAESIVGRTNVQVEEPFWFRDEFGENSLGRYLGTKAGLTVSGGKLVPTTTSQNLKLPSTLKYVESKFDFRIDTTFYLTETSRASLIFGVQTDFTTATITSGYAVTVAASVSSTVIGLYKDVYTALESSALGYALTVDTDYEIKAVHSAGNIKVYLDDVLVIDFDDATYTSGYAGLMIHSSGNSSSANIRIDNLQISGTRVYNKPIHRGAMLETYHDGTQEVVGTTFVDDCQWDRSAEYVAAGWAHNAANGYYSNTYDVSRWTKQKFGDGIYEFRFHPTANATSPVACDVHVSFFSQVQNVVEFTDNTSYTGETYYLTITAGSSNAIITHTSGVGSGSSVKTTIGTFTLPSATGEVGVSTKFRLEVFNNVAKLFVNDVKATNDITLTKGLTNGYFGFNSLYKTTAGSYEFGISGINIIAASPDATNGIAACIPPIGGGARYGVQEGASIEFTNKALRGDYDFNACVKTTVTGGTPYYEMFFKNTTDDTAIAADSTTLKNVEPLLVTYTDFEQALNLGYADRDDTISVQVRRHTSAPDEVNTAAYIDFMAVVPTKEVI